MNLRFTLGYKGDFNVRLVAIGISDPADDDIDGFVDEFSTFDKLKRACGASNLCDPTDITSALGLEGNVSGYLYSEFNPDDPLAIDSFGINIRVPVFDSATRDVRRGTARRGSDIVECLGSPTHAIVNAIGPGMKGPVIVAVLPATMTVPAVTVTSTGALSKVTVIVPFAAISPPGGVALTKLAGTGSSMSLSPPQPANIATASKPVSNNAK